MHLETIGRPSHSSAPHLGRNAVLDMLRVVQEAERIDLPEDPFMGPAILALTDIISDPYPGHSVIPSICRVTVDRRLLPGETAQDVLAAITARPGLEDIRLNATIGSGTGRTQTGHAPEKFFPAWALPEDDAYVQAALRATPGLQPKIGAYRFCTARPGAG